MTEFQMQTNPFPSSIATGCNVLMTSDRVVRQESCYDGSNTDDDDDDDDVTNMDASGSVDTKANNGQWVRLSKSLLLQLVERICMLSFHQAENQAQSSTAVAQRRQADVESRQLNAIDKRRGSSSSNEMTEVSHVVASSPSDTERVAETMLVASSIKNCSSRRRTSPSKTKTTGRDVDLSSPIKMSSKKRCLVRTGPAAQNAMSAGVCGRCDNDDVSNEKIRDCKAAAGNSEKTTSACIEKDLTLASPMDAVLVGKSVANKPCSLARRRHRLNAANVLRRHRQRSRRRRSQLSRRHVSSGTDDAAGHHGLLKRPLHQSWLALNKSLVLCALDRALRTEDAMSAKNDGSSGSSRSGTGGGSDRVAKSIWNPVTSLSRYEARTAKTTAELVSPFNAACWSPMWMTSSNGDPQILTCPQAATLAAAASSYSCTNSSLLCSLLGFDAGSATKAGLMITTSSAAPSENGSCHRTPSEYYAYARAEMNESLLSESRRREEEEADANTTSADVPRALSSVGTEIDVKSPEKSCPNDMTSSPRLIIGAPSGCRGRMHQRNGLTDELKPGCMGDKWIVLDKGDVYSLVESLVNTMIANGAPGDRLRVAPSVTTDHTANKEPRKWKSNLLQRLRTETQ